MKTIPVAGPWITEKEISYVTDAATHGWYGATEDYLKKFEQAVAAYVDRDFAIALPSCTSALHLSLLALGIGPGDEVIVPEITWIATAAPITYVGATPIFADIERDSWCMSASSLEEKINPRTKAIITVDLYGHPANYDLICAIADKHNIALIEDGAQAIGALYHQRKCGNFGDISVFSFHGSKTVTTGEGGMLLTNDEAIYRRCLFLRDHGRAPGERKFWNSEVAYKYRMSAMQAALGLAQIERIEELISRKREIFSWYKKYLERCSMLRLNFEQEGSKSTYWMVTAVIDKSLKLEKEELMKRLECQYISSRPFFYPLSSLPAYSSISKHGDYAQINPNSYDISPRAINLPSGFDLDERTVERVCEVLQGAILDT